jgi:hypothetical protein
VQSFSSRNNVLPGGEAEAAQHRCNTAVYDAAGAAGAAEIKAVIIKSKTLAAAPAFLSPRLQQCSAEQRQLALAHMPTLSSGIAAQHHLCAYCCCLNAHHVMQELLASVAPQKANWDLKREVEPRLAKPLPLITLSVSNCHSF